MRKSLLILALLSLPFSLVEAAPKPFFQQGTVNPISVGTSATTGDLTKNGSSTYTNPVLARASDGGFFVGNRRTLTKLTSAGATEWSVSFVNSTAVSGDITTYSEHWSHTIAERQTWNLSLAQDLADAEVVWDIEITHVFPSPTAVVIVARVVTGKGPTVYLARFDQDGRFEWRQVTSVGTSSSDPYTGNDTIQALIDGDADVIHIIEAGNSKPVSRYTQIDLETGDRGASYTFGFNNSETPQTKNYQIVKSILLSNGRIVWLARCSDAFVTATLGQVPTSDRIQLFNSATLDVEDEVIFLRSAGTPSEAGYIQSNVTDIALDNQSKLLVLANLSEQFAEAPILRTNINLRAFNLDLFNEDSDDSLIEPLWTYSPAGEEWADKILVTGEKLTLIGNYPYFDNRFNGWEISRHTLNGGETAPTPLWKRDLPFDSPYYRPTGSYKDVQVDASGNIYLTASYDEYNSDSETLLEPVLCYVKYSDAGALQFFKQLPGYDFSGSSNSPAPAQLLLDPSPDADKDYLLVTTPETSTDYSSSTKYWTFLSVEHEDNVNAPALAFAVPSGAIGTAVDPITIRTATDGGLNISLPTNGTPYRVWTESTLPEGGGFLDGLNGSDATSSTSINGVLFGPITAPYGTYTFTVYASDAGNTISQTFTIQNYPAAPGFTKHPVGGLVAKKGSFALKATVTGGGTITYQWQKKIGLVWTNISGATGTNYTITNATVSYRYRLLATNLGGTATSIEALVTIDTTKPGISISGPAGAKTTKASTAVTGSAGDNLKVAAVKFRYKLGKGKYSSSKSATLASGTTIRKFSATVATKTKGVYTVELTVTDTSGNATVKVYKLTRK